MYEDLIYREDFIEELDKLDSNMAKLEKQIRPCFYLSEEKSNEFHRLLREGRSAVEKARSDLKKKVPMMYSEVLTPIHDIYDAVLFGDLAAALAAQMLRDDNKRRREQVSENLRGWEDYYMLTDEERYIKDLEELYADEIAEERKLIALEEEENN